MLFHIESLGTWEENLSKFELGESYIGKIRDITNYGAFIELTPNLTGLSDIPKELKLKVGDTVNVLYKSNNPEKLKVKLQIQSLAQEEYKIEYTYFDVGEKVKIWLYTPPVSKKKISTVFK